MRILYGVQGTGNGHISRARAMSKALAAYPDLKVTWLFRAAAKRILSTWIHLVGMSIAKA